MYSYNDIQNMINDIKNNPVLKQRFFANLRTNAPDREAIHDVISEGYVDRFERYDSAVCETFINAYESVKGV